MIRMDPPAMMNEGGPYTLEEIWQFPIIGSGRGQFELLNLERRAAASARKRREVDLDVDDSSSSKPTTLSPTNANTNTNGLLVFYPSLDFFLIYFILCFIDLNQQQS